MHLSPMKRAVLAHGYRQGILLPAVASKQFNAGKPVDRLFRELEADCYIKQFKRTIQSRYNYAQVDVAGHKVLSVDSQSPRALSETRLNQRIGLSWFCSMEESIRYVIQPSELRKRFGNAISTKHRHVVSNEFDCPVALRVYHATGSNRSARDHINSFLREHRTKQGVASELEHGQYGLAVLAPSSHRVAEITEYLTEAAFFQRVRLVVGLAPTAETFGDCMANRSAGGTDGCGDGARMNGD